MKIIRNPGDLPRPMKPAVIAIGNFDGVHKGHQALLSQAQSIARQKGADFLVLTFEPHPRAFFRPDTPAFRITPASLKEDLFRQLIRPDYYVSLSFNTAMASLTAEDFIRDILVESCNAAAVVVGKGFHFGKGRGGTVETLRSCGDFETVALDLTPGGAAPVSSSRIRAHLQEGAVDEANALLGWEWAIRSRVVHGDKRGRELGYPTANMHFGDSLVPAHGIYAVRVKIDGEDTWRRGAANIGIRPMFESAEPLLETYIFDFDGDLYGRILTVRPVKKLRDEMKFDSLDALVAQMDKDCAAAFSALI